MHSKKLLIIFLSIFLLAGITGCGTDKTTSTGTQPETELIVFAAASMAEVIEEINRVYMEENRHITVIANIDSSGTLKTQIEEGAACDVFISAAQKAMNEIDISADPEVNLDRLDFVLQGTRRNILENKVVLAVSDGNPKNIESFDGLAAHLTEGDILMAMGNTDVPVGQYTNRILEYYNFDLEELAASGVISYASTVKEATTQMAEGLVDCGIIFLTDAVFKKLKVVDTANVEMTGGRAIYPAAIMKNSKSVDEAQAYLDFLASPEGALLLEAYGFTPIR